MNVDDTVTRWRAEEDAVRARLAAAPGVAHGAQISGRTGMEMLNAIFAGELPRPPIGDTLDFVPIHIEPGVAVFKGRPYRFGATNPVAPATIGQRSGQVVLACAYNLPSGPTSRASAVATC